MECVVYCDVVVPLGTFPIDLTKTRLQIQGQAIDMAHKQLKYRGMVHAVMTIAREESVKALYSGCVPTYITIVFARFML